jgi:AraC-like DNA-binding protein
VQHFNRIFRRHQDMSPARWRQRILAPAPPDGSENVLGVPAMGTRGP